MINELVSLSDDERECLIQFNLDKMAHEHDRDTAMRYWQRASLLIRGRSMACVAKMERARGLAREAAL
jgi:hypothetical protein